MTLILTSTAFDHMGAIPVIHTCQGDDVSPPLAWDGVPDGTQSLVLIVDDPDAPDPAAPKTTWVHWVLYDLPAQCVGLHQGAAVGGLPPRARDGLNDWKRAGYGGPCPPIGRHRYVFKLYALNAPLGDLGPRADKAAVLTAMDGKVMDKAELIGTYAKG
ncbi:MAG: YbhB/YbcL family Raf kinase inhibitor-like protein [Alphaproteobacteria bacterium]|nr:YbhB/YbcL family Raf kinase inhibitor-like protein [Alphaproteobacteria bacterium]MBF0251108.1 YbhB/YbcL family Raf kinase inhibitor-like protein [Alphaproteobacteria bacterium]